jgi:hypothetical protein
MLAAFVAALFFCCSLVPSLSLSLSPFFIFFSPSPFLLLGLLARCFFLVPAHPWRVDHCARSLDNFVAFLSKSQEDRAFQ